MRSGHHKRVGKKEQQWEEPLETHGMRQYSQDSLEKLVGGDGGYLEKNICLSGK